MKLISIRVSSKKVLRITLPNEMAEITGSGLSLFRLILGSFTTRVTLS